MRKLVSIVGVLCAVVLVPFALAAQQTATTPVTIRVSDPTGAVIPHAQIRLVPAPDPVPGRLETDDQGQFSINLKTGGYALTVSAQGFKNWVEHIYIHAPESHAVASQSVPVVLDVGRYFFTNRYRSAGVACTHCLSEPCSRRVLAL